MTHRPPTPRGGVLGTWAHPDDTTHLSAGPSAPASRGRRTGRSRGPRGEVAP